MRNILRKCLSISLATFMLASGMPMQLFAQELTESDIETLIQKWRYTSHDPKNVIRTTETLQEVLPKLALTAKDRAGAYVDYFMVAYPEPGVNSNYINYINLWKNNLSAGNPIKEGEMAIIHVSGEVAFVKEFPAYDHIYKVGDKTVYVRKINDLFPIDPAHQKYFAPFTFVTGKREFEDNLLAINCEDGKTVIRTNPYIEMEKNYVLVKGSTDEQIKLAIERVIQGEDKVGFVGRNITRETLPTVSIIRKDFFMPSGAIFRNERDYRTLEQLFDMHTDYINTLLKENNKGALKFANETSSAGFSKEYLTYLQQSTEKYFKDMPNYTRQAILEDYLGQRVFDKSASKIFPTQESKADFLRYVWNRTIKIMRENDPGSEQKLLQALFLREGDTSQIVIGKLQRVLRLLGEEAPKSVSSSLLQMMKIINTMPESKVQKYIAKANRSLTDKQKALINDIQRYVYEDGNPRLYDLLFLDAANSIPENQIARTAARKAAGTAAKVVTPAIAILGNLWILNAIVNIDASNNSFANAMDPAAIKQKIKNGTANRYEQFAFYMMPSSSSYIEEDPVQFASVILSAAEAVTNPDIKRLMQDPVMQIKGWEGSTNIGLNEKLDAEIEKALDNIKLDNSQFPQA